MAMIIHRCTYCGHPDVHHDPLHGKCEHRATGCPCPGGDSYGPAEVIPSWKSEPVTALATQEPLVPPGTPVSFGGLKASTPTHDCLECLALYRGEAA